LGCSTGTIRGSHRFSRPLVATAAEAGIRSTPVCEQQPPIGKGSNMRKLIVAAATAATVSTLGLTATAQALSVSQGAGRATAAVSKTVVAGIPAAFTIVQASTTKCVWKTTGLPGPVTSGIGGKNNCTNLIDGVFPKPGTVKITAKVTHGGKV